MSGFLIQEIRVLQCSASPGCEHKLVVGVPTRVSAEPPDDGKCSVSFRSFLTFPYHVGSASETSEEYCNSICFVGVSFQD